MTWKSSYEEGLSALLAGEFDACILDYRLGQRTGLELLAEVRGKGSRCPIIVLTGYGDHDLDLQAMEAGAADYLVKGQISAPLLDRAIRYSIKNARDMQALADERENFQTLFNSTFEGVVVVSHGKVLAANRAVCDIFKCPPEEFIGRDFAKFIREEIRQEMKSALDSGRDLRMECPAKTLDGSEIYLGVLSRTVCFKGQWASLVAIRDLTERRMMETQILQQDRLASLGLLASSLAHEIGTPLGVIRGRAEQVQHRDSDAKNKEIMSVIITQIDRISKLVSSLLQIAGGRNTGSASEVSLDRALTDVLELISHEIERNDIRLKLSVRKGILVQAESAKLAQVFLNLLVNAIHAIVGDRSKQKREIKVAAIESDRQVHVSVEDSGTGIDEENFPRLFQPFFTTKDVGEGTGLGLATSYKIVNSWGGWIEVQSKKGKGSTFTVILQK
jgi:PAS domain S-box-containing protein